MMEKDAFDERDMTILIVDDEPRIRDFVRMNLELEHYRVLEANNGQEALDQLRENLPDLVVLDVMMPEMDGFETLRAIREVSTVPVIMLTVRQNEQDRIRGLDWGPMIISRSHSVRVNCCRASAPCYAVRLCPRPLVRPKL